MRIVSVALHPRYEKIAVDVHGKSSVFSPDVALMTLNEKLAHPLEVASKAELAQLRPGDAVQYIGFPIENLAGDNVNLNNVMAITQTGAISAISNWWLGDSGAEKNQLIRHNMGATGGASGSPIFNQDGKVIGLLNAGNIVENIKITNNGKLSKKRTPSAALVNFGVRVDLLDGVKLR